MGQDFALHGGRHLVIDLGGLVVVDHVNRTEKLLLPSRTVESARPRRRSRPSRSSPPDHAQFPREAPKTVPDVKMVRGPHTYDDERNLPWHVPARDEVHKEEPPEDADL